MSKTNVHTTQDFGLSAEYHASTSIPERYQGSPEDRHDMAVLGKQQVLCRNFSLFSMLGFASLAVMSWEIMPVFLIFSLIDGGPPAVFWKNVVGASFMAGSIIQGLIALNVEGYEFHRWHGTLLTIAAAIFAVAANIVLAKSLPYPQYGVLVLHFSLDIDQVYPYH